MNVQKATYIFDKRVVLQKGNAEKYMYIFLLIYVYMICSYMVKEIIFHKIVEVELWLPDMNIVTTLLCKYIAMSVFISQRRNTMIRYGHHWGSSISMQNNTGLLIR